MTDVSSQPDRDTDSLPATSVDGQDRDSEGTLELPAHPVVTAVHRRRGMFFLGLAVAGVGVTMALQMGLNANFLAQEMKISGDQMGMLEAFRESCGVIAIGVLALLAGVVEPLVGVAMLLLLAAGLGAYSFVPNYFWIVAMSLVWSQGLHVWMPLPNSMTLAMAEPGRTGYRLGQIGAAGSAGFGLGLAAAFVLTLAGVAIRPMYLLAGVTAVLAAVACLGIPRQIKTPGPRLVLRRRYGLYYLLCFLEGWRKQIFLCFAGFLLVKIYNTPLTTMLLLYATVQVIGYVASPRVGRLIDRVGERRVLICYFSSLSLVFVGYAFIPYVYVLYVLFVADSAFFTLSMALTTYVNRIAPHNEHTQTLGMGVAMNHVAAVTMPLVGGLLWKYMGYQYPFLVGTVAAVASIFVAARLPMPTGAAGAGVPAAATAEVADPAAEAPPEG